MYEMSHQSRFNARYWMLGAGALGRPRGRVWGGRREEGSGWGTHVYLWRIHFDIWQNQYNIVKFKNKIKLKKNNKKKQKDKKKKKAILDIKSHLNKVQHQFMIKISCKLYLEGDFLNVIKTYASNLQQTTYFRETLDQSPLLLETYAGV